MTSGADERLEQIAAELSKHIKLRVKRQNSQLRGRMVLIQKKLDAKYSLCDEYQLSLLCAQQEAYQNLLVEVLGAIDDYAAQTVMKEHAPTQCYAKAFPIS